MKWKLFMIKSQKIKNFLECVIGKECSKTIFFPGGSIFVEKDDVLYPSDVNKLIKSKDDKDFLSITSFEFIKNTISFVLGQDCLINECQNITVKSETMAALNGAKENNAKHIDECNKGFNKEESSNGIASKKDNADNSSKKTTPIVPSEQKHGINSIQKDDNQPSLKSIDKNTYWIGEEAINASQKEYALELYKYICSIDFSSITPELLNEKIKNDLETRFNFEVKKGKYNGKKGKKNRKYNFCSKKLPFLTFESARYSSAIGAFLKLIVLRLKPAVESNFSKNKIEKVKNVSSDNNVKFLNGQSKKRAMKSPAEKGVINFLKIW